MNSSASNTSFLSQSELPGFCHLYDCRNFFASLFAADANSITERDLTYMKISLPAPKTVLYPGFLYKIAFPLSIPRYCCRIHDVITGSADYLPDFSLTETGNEITSLHEQIGFLLFSAAATHFLQVQRFSMQSIDDSILHLAPLSVADSKVLETGKVRRIRDSNLRCKRGAVWVILGATKGKVVGLLSALRIEGRWVTPSVQ